MKKLSKEVVQLFLVLPDQLFFVFRGLKSASVFPILFQFTIYNLSSFFHFLRESLCLFLSLVLQQDGPQPQIRLVINLSFL